MRNWDSLRRNMRGKLFLTPGLAALVVVGCGKKPEPPPATPEPAQSQRSSVSTLLDAAPAAPAAPAPAAAVAAPAVPETPQVYADKLPTAPPDSGKETSHIPMTEALQRFVERNNRLPNDFNELVKSKFLPKIPPPPAGKTYAIDRKNMQVVLINQ